jgi:hypothetical protein
LSKVDATLERAAIWRGFSSEHSPLVEAGRIEGLYGRLERLTALNLVRSNWKEGMFSTALEQEQLIGRLAKLYTFNDYVSVANFLRGNTFLLNVLLEAHDKIQTYFGLHTNVVLEVFTDHEAENDQELFALIQANLSIEEELDALDKLYEGWWLDALPAAKCKLTIDVG